jgi:transcriptional regulator with XRE-family HTH domain
MTVSARITSPVEQGKSSPSARLEMAHIVARNVNRIRVRRGYSFSRLSALANVSQSMLHSIERGKSVPTIVVLSKIAQALEVKIDTLLSTKASDEVVAATALVPSLPFKELRYVCRSLSHGDAIEVLELRLIGTQIFAAEPRGASFRAHIVVSSGRLAVTTGDGQSAKLQRGDALVVAADVAFSLRNASSNTATVHVVFTSGAATDWGRQALKADSGALGFAAK